MLSLSRSSLSRSNAKSLRFFSVVTSSACWRRHNRPGTETGPGTRDGTGTRTRISRRFGSGSGSAREVRIGCASGFWGDTATSVPQLVHRGRLDFLVFDYLSEITMSLLSTAKERNPALGFAPDFVSAALSPFINDIHRKGIRVISNGGGVNPLACGAAIRAVVEKAGLNMKVAVVTGDDLMGQKESLSSVRSMDGENNQRLPDNLTSINAYLGAVPIQRALDHGADIVVLGRCVDSALALGPLMHSFGWKTTDYDLLAAGSLAGHLIECGAQSTGGIFTDWQTVPDWDIMGFPVVACSPDGSFVLSKPEGTGGLVSVATAAEQLVYEIHDPRRYQLPDVTADFSRVSITDIPGIEGGAVRVSGASGVAPSPHYKVCSTYLEGFRSTAVCCVGGPRSDQKGRRTAESIIKRCRRIFSQVGLEDFSSINVQILGAEDTYGPHAKTTGCREAVIWLAVTHKQKKALELFSREIAAAGTGMAPGLTAIVGGRPRVSPVLKLFSFLLPKTSIQAELHMDGEWVESLVEAESPVQEEAPPQEEDQSSDAELPSGRHSYRLEELVYTRSGDKGDTCNIGVIARHPLFFPYLKKHLTSSVVEDYFSHLLQPTKKNAVTRYCLPGIFGLNFVLQNSLGGGGVASLRSDPQGKAWAQMLLDLRLDGLPDLKSLVD